MTTKVDNTQQDDFADNPLLMRDPSLRAYAQDDKETPDGKRGRMAASPPFFPLLWQNAEIFILSG